MQTNSQTGRGRGSGLHGGVTQYARPFGTGYPPPRPDEPAASQRRRLGASRRPSDSPHEPAAAQGLTEGTGGGVRLTCCRLRGSQPKRTSRPAQRSRLAQSFAALTPALARPNHQTHEATRSPKRPAGVFLSDLWARLSPRSPRKPQTHETNEGRRNHFGRKERPAYVDPPTLLPF